MNRYAITLSGLILAISAAWGYCQVPEVSEAMVKYDFSSDSAKMAVRKFASEMENAETEYKKAIATARESFRNALSDVLKLAANQNQLKEVKSITDVLQLEDEQMNPPKVKEKVTSTTKLRQQIKSLEEENAKLKKTDPIVGRWNYNNGNICEFTPDGFIVLNSTLIGIWRVKTSGTYVTAFTRNFASGEHDDVVLAPSRNAFKANGKSSSIMVNRVQ